MVNILFQQLFQGTEENASEYKAEVLNPTLDLTTMVWALT
jgi:hypothetical protein